MNEFQKELLYRSYSGTLSRNEQTKLEQALSESAELRAEQSQILAMHGLLKNAAVTAFGPFFPERVMNRLAETNLSSDHTESIWESVQSLFRWVAITAAPVTIALIIWNSILAEVSDTTGSPPDGVQIEPSVDIWETPLESALKDLS